MEQGSPISPRSDCTWQISQKSQASGKEPSLVVTAQGHSFQQKQATESSAQRLLDTARGFCPPSESSTNIKETLSRFSNADCVAYERRDYQFGQLSSVLQRFLPLRSLQEDGEGALARIEAWAHNHADLDAAQSLSLIKKKDVRSANYTVYISASREGQVAALRLSKLIDSIGPEWGLHSSFLDYHEAHDEASYQAAIDNSDLFIALIDDDYGLSGTRSQLELRYAASLGSKKSWPWLAGVYLATRHDWVTEIIAQNPALFLHGKNPKEHVERIAGFMLSLLIRKKRREQTSTV